jgi:transcriptional regulator with XRE-family HTH domain
MPEPMPNVALRAAREAHPYSREELAEKVRAKGVPCDADDFYRWENEGQIPRARAQRAICAVLKKSPAELG